jgi:transmembrane sensor
VVREALTREALSALEPREAAALFIARRGEGLTIGEQQLLAEWLARDEVHRRMFESADRAWQLFADAEGDELLGAMRAHALASRRSSWARRWPLAAAAAALFAVIGGALFLLRTPMVTEIRYASVSGEVKELQLPDGSDMTLDADSGAIARFSKKERIIQLQRGRAYFAVTPDASRPFTVLAAGQRIVVVGTRFDVNLVGDGLTVTLLEGRVEVESTDSARAPVTMEPGQQFVRRGGNATLRNAGEGSENAVAWRTGFINFDDQPLSDAVAVMNRYSSDQIVINDPAVAALRLSGQFRAGETQRFADTLADMHDLRVVRQENRIELMRP